MHGFFCLNAEEANAMKIEIRRITILKESAKLKIYLSNQWVLIGDDS
jgi:hypothetical protein